MRPELSLSSLGIRTGADTLERGFARLYLTSSEGRQTTIRYVHPWVTKNRRALSDEYGRGSTPRKGAGSMATVVDARPRPARI